MTFSYGKFFLQRLNNPSFTFLNGVALCPAGSAGPLVGETVGFGIAEEIVGVGGVLANCPKKGAGGVFANGADGPWIEFAEGDGGVAEDAPAHRVGMKVAELDQGRCVFDVRGADGALHPHESVVINSDELGRTPVMAHYADGVLTSIHEEVVVQGNSSGALKKALAMIVPKHVPVNLIEVARTKSLWRKGSNQEVWAQS